jgi:hypothetical protein
MDALGDAVTDGGAVGQAIFKHRNRASSDMRVLAILMR